MLRYQLAEVEIVASAQLEILKAGWLETLPSSKGVDHGSDASIHLKSVFENWRFSRRGNTLVLLPTSIQTEINEELATRLVHIC